MNASLSEMNIIISDIYILIGVQMNRSVALSVLIDQRYAAKFLITSFVN